MEKVLKKKPTSEAYTAENQGVCSNPGTEEGGDKGFCREASDWV